MRNRWYGSLRDSRKVDFFLLVESRHTGRLVNRCDPFLRSAPRLLELHVFYTCIDIRDHDSFSHFRVIYSAFSMTLSCNWFFTRDHVLLGFFELVYPQMHQHKHGDRLELQGLFP